MKKIKIKTSKRLESIDITQKIKEIIKKEKVKKGVVFLFSPHTTASLLINEGYDKEVLHDLMSKLSELVPYNSKYKHIEGNSDSHIKSSLIGNQLYLIIENEEIKLGRWQSVFFLEFDGPREREIWVKIIKE